MTKLYTYPGDDPFYIIYASESGAVVRKATRAELLEMMSQNLQGNADLHENRIITDSIQDSLGLSIYEKRCILIIHGKQVIPVPQKVVTSYALDEQ